MTFGEILAIGIVVLAGFQFAAIMKWGWRKLRARAAARAPATKHRASPAQLGSKPGCTCHVCSWLAANPAYRVDQKMADQLQAMLYMAGSGMPAAISPIDTVGPNGVRRTVIAAFNGAIFDSAILPAIRKVLGGTQG